MKPPPAVLKLGRNAVVSAVLVMMLEACDGGGTTGPPPLPPEMVTESEARTVIDQVFTDNGVSLTADVMKQFIMTAADTANVELDGYNDSLEVGYEYIYHDDYAQFNLQLVTWLNNAASGSGPYIKAINEVPKEDGYETVLQGMVQEFVDSLKAQGVI
jgi:hypothetical protein